MPVIVFFDEMDSTSATRCFGVSSDVENTIVPQLLSEIDGVEGLENVIVIGASNREDMIDPAILRHRADWTSRSRSSGRTPRRPRTSSPSTRHRLPLHPDDVAENGGSSQATVDAMIQRTVERSYTESEENRFLEATYANGDKEVLYFKDFNSGDDDREHRGPGQEDGHQGVPRDRPEGHAATNCWPRASTSSARTRTCSRHHDPDDGVNLRQEGRAHRLHQDPGFRQDRDRGGWSIDTVANTAEAPVMAQETVSACLVRP